MCFGYIISETHNLFVACIYFELVPALLPPYNSYMTILSDHLILIRGGGDLASGVAWRLHRAGLQMLITEQPQPLAVRRLVSFCEAVYRDAITVEGVTARRAETLDQALSVLHAGQIPVLVDPQLVLCADLKPLALIDARMTKRPPKNGAMDAASLTIGLGPGFVAGENCHVAIETNRGHFLGRTIWQGATQTDTGIPGAVASRQSERVLRAPADGIFHPRIAIGERVARGQVIAEVEGQPINAVFDGILRGLLHAGLPVTRGLKVGDLDPRLDPRYARTISEKSLAIGGGVIEALLTRPEIRTRLWN